MARYEHLPIYKKATVLLRIAKDVRAFASFNSYAYVSNLVMDVRIGARTRPASSGRFC